MDGGDDAKERSDILTLPEDGLLEEETVRTLTEAEQVFWRSAWDADLPVRLIGGHHGCYARSPRSDARLWPTATRDASRSNVPQSHREQIVALQEATNLMTKSVQQLRGDLATAKATEQKMFVVAVLSVVIALFALIPPVVEMLS
jgi:hypothetical protein